MTGRPLLLDEMISKKVALELRAQGADVEAVLLDRPELRGMADEELLETASSEGRVLVTKNIVDFGPLVQRWESQGRRHAGLVFISSKTFPESRDWIGAVASALARARLDGVLPDPGGVLWLSR